MCVEGQGGLASDRLGVKYQLSLLFTSYLTPLNLNIFIMKIRAIIHTGKGVNKTACEKRLTRRTWCRRCSKMSGSTETNSLIACHLLIMNKSFEEWPHSM